DAVSIAAAALPAQPVVDASGSLATQELVLSRAEATDLLAALAKLSSDATVGPAGELAASLQAGLDCSQGDSSVVRCAFTTADPSTSLLMLYEALQTTSCPGRRAMAWVWAQANTAYLSLAPEAVLALHRPASVATLVKDFSDASFRQEHVRLAQLLHVVDLHPSQLQEGPSSDAAFDGLIFADAGADSAPPAHPLQAVVSAFEERRMAAEAYGGASAALAEQTALRRRAGLLAACGYFIGHPEEAPLVKEGVRGDTPALQLRNIFAADVAVADSSIGGVSVVAAFDPEFDATAAVADFIGGAPSADN
ncbi:unnamed protein product, partial [Symbiodinium sp. KB8]